MGVFSKRKGLFLLELSLIMAILLLGIGMAAPLFTNWQEEQRVEMAAAAVSAIIRDVQESVKNGDAKLPYGSERLNLYFVNQGEAVQYYTVRGVNIVKPSGYLPKGVKVYKTTVLTFRKDGFAGTSDEYSVTLLSQNKKYKRVVILAMYTGRTRIEKG